MRRTGYGEIDSTARAHDRGAHEARLVSTPAAAGAPGSICRSGGPETEQEKSVDTFTGSSPRLSGPAASTSFEIVSHAITPPDAATAALTIIATWKPCVIVAGL